MAEVYDIEYWRTLANTKIEEYKKIEADFEEFKETSNELEQGLELENAEILKKVEKLKKENLFYENEVEKLRRKYKEECLDVEKECDKLKKELNERIELIKAHESRIVSLELENEEYEQQLRITETIITDLEQKFETSLEEVALLQSELDELKNHSEEQIQRLKQQVDEGNVEIEVKDREIKNLLSEIRSNTYNLNKSSSIIVDNSGIKTPKNSILTNNLLDGIISANSGQSDENRLLSNRSSSSNKNSALKRAMTLDSGIVKDKRSSTPMHTDKFKINGFNKRSTVIGDISSSSRRIEQENIEEKDNNLEDESISVNEENEIVSVVPSSLNTSPDREYPENTSNITQADIKDGEEECPFKPAAPNSHDNFKKQPVTEQPVHVITSFEDSMDSEVIDIEALLSLDLNTNPLMGKSNLSLNMINNLISDIDDRIYQLNKRRDYVNENDEFVNYFDRAANERSKRVSVLY